MESKTYVRMSMGEVHRFEIMEKIISKQMTRHEGAKTLNISYRQVLRLIKRYDQEGVEGLVSKKRGMKSNNRLAKDVVKQVIDLIKTRYYDFGPTFAHEKLTEVHHLQLSVESCRQIMLKHDLWKGKERKDAQVHQMRLRRAAVGELVQVDGSPHEWFEDRGPKCTLLVYIDDATSRLMHMQFEEEETCEGYMDATKYYVQKHGIPLAFYSDKHGVFRVNAKDAVRGTGETQYGRAVRALGIELIHANSPQAKGRVENVNGTLQDRLVKEMRLKGLSDRATANAYLPKFIEDYNKRFEKRPRSSQDAHRQLIPDPKTLDLILCKRHIRTISKNLEVRYNNKIYQIQTKGMGYTMRRSKVHVHDHKGEVTLIYKGRILAYKIFSTGQRQAPIAGAKEVNKIVDRKKRYKPSASHPWKRYVVQSAQH